MNESICFIVDYKLPNGQDAHRPCTVPLPNVPGLSSWRIAAGLAAVLENERRLGNTPYAVFYVPEAHNLKQIEKLSVIFGEMHPLEVMQRQAVYPVYLDVPLCRA
jgi:hypothetical protein